MLYFFFFGMAVLVTVLSTWKTYVLKEKVCYSWEQVIVITLKNFILREKTLKVVGMKLYVASIFSHGLFRLPGLCLPWKFWRNVFLSHSSIPSICRMMAIDRWTYILVCALNHKCVLHSPHVSTFIFVGGQGKERYIVCSRACEPQYLAIVTSSSPCSCIMMSPHW